MEMINEQGVSKMNKMPDLQELMQKAQMMQEKMKQAQEDVQSINVTGRAPATATPLVLVVMNGKHQLEKVEIADELWNDKANKEMAEDLIAAAVRHAVQLLAEASQQKMAGLDMPAGFEDFIK